MPEKIFGKEYNTVAERIVQIQSNGLDNATASVETTIEKHWEGPNGLYEVIVKATVTYNDLTFTGYAHEREAAYQEGKGDRQQSVNWSSYIENAETSAVGRALGMAGLGGIAVASADEMFGVLQAENTELKARLAKAKVEFRKLRDSQPRPRHADDDAPDGYDGYDDTGKEATDESETI